MSYGYPHNLNPVTSYRAALSAPEVIGPVAEGLRFNFYITGGELLGPRIKGLVKPGGADWLTVRSDGVGLLDVRSTLETDDAALIYVRYTGIAEFGPDGYQNFLNGVPLPEGGIDLRVRPVFQTAHPDYQWLNRAFCVGIGKAFGSEVCYDVYELA